MPNKKTKSNKNKRGGKGRQKKEKNSATEKNASDEKEEERSIRPEVKALIEVCRTKTDWNEDLFKQPPPRDDCPICFLRFPAQVRAEDQALWDTIPWYPCCGKRVCLGCNYAHNDSAVGRESCPFCRALYPRSAMEYLALVNNRAKKDDAEAFVMLAKCYSEGGMGLPKYHAKSFEMGERAAELGSIEGHALLAKAYQWGEGVEKDPEKAIQHYQIAAIGGNEDARFQLGFFECLLENHDRSLKHYVIAASAGCSLSLKCVMLKFMEGHASKADYEKTLRAWKDSIDEMESKERSKAARERVE